MFDAIKTGTHQALGMTKDYCKYGHLKECIDSRGYKSCLVCKKDWSIKNDD